MAQCRSCGAEIVWTHDASTGRRIPLDAASRELRYTQVGEDRWRLVPTFESHFARCPGQAAGPVGIGRQWQPESLLGGVVDGLPARVDRHRWPAGPGQRQHEWEPARVVGRGVPDRARRVGALGNAVVPQIVELIGRAILDAHTSGGDDALGDGLAVAQLADHLGETVAPVLPVRS